MDPVLQDSEHGLTKRDREILRLIARNLRVYREPSNSRNAAHMDLITPARVGDLLRQQGAGPTLLTSFMGRSVWRQIDPLLNTKARHDYAVTAICRRFQATLPISRPFTDAELSAVAKHASSNINIRSAAPLVGLPLALALFVKGFEKMRFPFIMPKWKRAKPEIFPLNRFPLLTGRRAWVAWHVARLVAYEIVCYWGVAPMVRSHADARTKAMMAQDPRLADMNRENAAALKRFRAGMDRPTPRPLPLPPVRASAQAGGAGSEGEREGEPDWWRTEQGSDVDASRSLQPQNDDGQAAQLIQGEVQNANASSEPPRRAVNRRDQWAEDQTSWKPQPPQPQAAQPPTPESNPLWDSDPLAMNDDASPVAPAAGQPPGSQAQGRPQRQPPPQAGQNGVSSWEAIRENARNQKSS